MSRFFGSQDIWTSKIRIYVGDERTRQATWKVFFHEMLHAVVEEYNIDEIRRLPDHEHERVIDTLATGLYDTLVRNKLVTLE